MLLALCSADDIRARIYTRLTDSDLENIIDDVSDEILGRTGATDETDINIVLAGKALARAATLKRMRTTGELAASKKQGNAQEQNTIDQDIKDYEASTEYYIQRYFSTPLLGIPSGRMGYGTVNNELS